MDRVCEKYKGKIMSAETAAAMIKSGMVLGMSGFTLVGYPKAVPAALAESKHAKDLSIFIGASVGDNLDGLLTRAGLVSRRFMYTSNKDMRAEINKGNIEYQDMHVTQFPLMLRRGISPKMDFAIVECSAITEEGLIPAASVGAMDAIVKRAEKVIVEINTTVPEVVKGMHDVFDMGNPPNARPIPIADVRDRIGTPYVPCPPEKIAAIVITDLQDQPPKFKTIDDTARKIGRNVVEFIKGEIERGFLPEKLPPFQSGVGSVGNAVLSALAESGFRDISMYTETMQDAGLDLIDQGVLGFVSTTAVSFSEPVRKRFYENIDFYRTKILLRNQEVSNNPEIARRLGVIAMNTPIEADIYGNVNSSHIMGSAIMNGIGGSGDFTRNAGLNIFATESIAKGGKISCLVPFVSHVDHTEHDVQVIVTEQGVADLRWKSPAEKAELIIENCTHPDYRPLLREYYEEARKVSYGLHTPMNLAKALSWHQKFVETGSML